MINGAVKPALLKRIKKLNQPYLGSPIPRVPCVIMSTRDEANHWIDIKHNTGHKGAGPLPWGSKEAARFRTRSGKKEPYLQVLDYLESHGAITPETRRKVPITNIKRLLNTPYIRIKLGIDKENGEINTRFDDAEIIKGLKWVVEDFASGKSKVEDIYTREKRIEYADKIPQKHLPKTANPYPDFRPLGDTLKPSRKRAIRRRRIKPSADRDTLAPTSSSLRIPQHRINNIYWELRNIPFDKGHNAISVLFRVFLELCLDHYFSENSLTVKRKGGDLTGAAAVDASLREKLTSVADHMAKSKILTKQQLVPVRRACQKDHFFAANITTFNQYVHNKHFTPSKSDLITAWDNLEHFFEALWE